MYNDSFDCRHFIDTVEWALEFAWRWKLKRLFGRKYEIWRYFKWLWGRGWQ